MVERREFENLFKPFNENGKQIWVISRVKELPLPIIKMALNLAALDFIKFINISDESLAASGENYPKRPKVPVTLINHETAIGVQILYSTLHKYINFYEINSPIKGNGSKMTEAILKDFPKDWQVAVLMDWSNGFWEKMIEKYKTIEWII